MPSAQCSVHEIKGIRNCPVVSFLVRNLRHVINLTFSRTVREDIEVATSSNKPMINSHCDEVRHSNLAMWLIEEKGADPPTSPLHSSWVIGSSPSSPPIE